MSYSHTKRRKTIAAFKRHGNNWGIRFKAHCETIRRINDGTLLGSLQDVIDSRSK